MSLLNTLFTALQGVWTHKLRAVLTMLGVVIGVASVIATLALGNGARAAVEANFRSLGANEIQIGAHMVFDEGQMMPAGRPLTFEDGLLLPEHAPLIESVAMRADAATRVRYGREVIDMSVRGTAEDGLVPLVREGREQPVGWPTGRSLRPEDFIERGRFFSRSEVLSYAPVCVLGAQTARDLFWGEEPLDQVITVGRIRCQVIGILRDTQSAGLPGESSSALYLPISTVISQLYREEASLSLTARVTDEAHMLEAVQQVMDYLRERHEITPDASGNYRDDFFITTRQQVLSAQQEAARTFSILLATMAIVSLIVGGIGIMNVMLVNVTERTREIGVRLAIGAERRDIILQFLGEAIVISLLGGVLGIALGTATVPVAASLNNGIALLAPESIPLALIVALLTGVVFGVYPAMRAAQLDPIEALRHD